MSKRPSILFMGTSPFAVPTLDALCRRSWPLVGVVTVPDKPQGRGQKMLPSPVKQYALEHQLPLFQPPRLKADSFLKTLYQLKPDLILVVAFRKLPQEIWDYPPLGTINLHASLLPLYRGAAPIHWCLIRGEKKTGLTTFFVTHNIDTGDLIFQEEEPILPSDTAGSLHDRLMYKGASLVLRTLEALSAEKVITKAQEYKSDYPLAPKLHRHHCAIDWQQPTHALLHFIRGLNPHPGAWTHLHGKPCKIFTAHKAASIPSLSVGKEAIIKHRLYMGAGDGVLEIAELQPEGRKRMPASDYLNGIRT